MGVDLDCLLLLLVELPLESILPPKRSATGLAEKKEGIGGGSKVDQTRLKEVYVPLKDAVQPLRALRPIEVDAI